MWSSGIQRKYHSKRVTAEPIASRPWFSWLCWIFRKWEFNEFQMGRWISSAMFWIFFMKRVEPHHQGSSEKQNQEDVCIFGKRFIIRIGSWDYGGWPVPGSVVSRLETQENLWGSSGLKVGMLKTRRERMFQFEFRGKKRLMSLLEGKEEKFPFLEAGSAFLLYLGLQLIGWDPLTVGRAICFSQSTNSDVSFIW